MPPSRPEPVAAHRPRFTWAPFENVAAPVNLATRAALLELEDAMSRAAEAARSMAEQGHYPELWLAWAAEAEADSLHAAAHAGEWST